MLCGFPHREFAEYGWLEKDLPTGEALNIREWKTTQKREWLGWQDSNLRMAIPKTAALPLGYTPRFRATYGTRLETSMGFFIKCRENVRNGEEAGDNF